MLRLNALFCCNNFSLAVIGTDQSEAKIIKVPAENINVEQPQIPGASKRRTAASKSSFEKKYQKILGLLQKDKKLIVRLNLHQKIWYRPHTYGRCHYW